MSSQDDLVAKVC